ncbi:hypothetical protein IU433_30590 [Nocardia puris]|uniref:hypothetical protein n=1 Tax=Nocardia puris TaxID=208602 RepID=UPI001894E722|nr:hypothetical protein [Nocardia puris]MBF6215183.1 hypothetical protein [Nocardia puris]MBF6463353.1 hypothetical protein [Nocardia puris]
MSSHPGQHRTFVHADGKLAEFMCQVSLMELTVGRARELQDIHRFHHPDECIVHLEAAYLLLVNEADC